MAIDLLPRLIRFRDAPSYMGMDSREFNKTVRPEIQEIKIGKIGVAFDRLDLDAWIEDYKSRSECPNTGDKLWGEQKQVASFPTKTKMAQRSTRSIKNTSEIEFLEEASKIMRRRSGS